MEVAVQWLDDLEDALFAIPLAWERLRLWCLEVGLIAALSSATIEFSHASNPWAPPFVAIAATSVGVWLIGVVVAEIPMRPQLDSASAPTLEIPAPAPI